MYNYYGFFSYKRHVRTDPWHAEVKSQIEAYIAADFQNASLKLFLDKVEILSGAYWKDTLTRALHHSPILIALCSPAYFGSPWCVAEMRTFMRREDTLGLPRGSLIKAAAVRDPAGFPDWAQEIQYDDFSDDFVVSDAYWRTEKAGEFSMRLMKFAEQAVALLQAHPAWRDDFPRIDEPEPVTPPDDRPLFPFGEARAA